MGRLSGTVALCVFLTLSARAIAGTILPREHDRDELVLSGLMESSWVPHDLFLSESIVDLKAVCGSRLSCPAASQQDIRDATRLQTFFFGEAARMSGQWGSDAIHRGAEPGMGPIQDGDSFVPAAVGTSYRVSTEPQGSVGQAIESIPVVELPLPPAFPLLATGIAALLIFAHRPRHR